MHFAERILHTKTILIDRLDLPECRDKRIEVDVLRLDMIHPVISGNKWFKLKYYLKEAIEKNHKTILTFGGAYSNHIVATACAAKMEGLHSIGIIRGEKPAELSQTLQTAQQYGMEFLFLSRAEYKRKSSADAVIIEKITARKDKKILLVTEDEGIISSVEHRIFALINVIDFYMFLFE